VGVSSGHRPITFNQFFDTQVKGVIAQRFLYTWLLWKQPGKGYKLSHSAHSLSVPYCFESSGDRVQFTRPSGTGFQSLAASKEARDTLQFASLSRAVCKHFLPQQSSFPLFDGLLTSYFRIYQLPRAIFAADRAVGASFGHQPVIASARSIRLFLPR
jgi:hypothetical protein